MPPIAGLALGGATSILGGILGGNAARKASKMQMAMAMKAANLGTESRDWANQVYDWNNTQAQNELERGRGLGNDFYGQGQNQLTQGIQNWSPFLQGGQQAFMNLGDLMKPGGLLSQTWDKTFNAPTGLTEQNDPGFQARLKLGQQMMERSAAAKGGLLTGGTAQAENQAAQDYASNEYGNVYNRAFGEYNNAYNIFRNNQNDQYQRLMGMTGVGETAANATGNLYGQSANLYGSQAGLNAGISGQEAADWMTHGAQVGGNIMNTANMVGQDYIGAGNAGAAGVMGQNNAYMGALNGLNGAFDMASLMRGSTNPWTGGSTNSGTGQVPSGNYFSATPTSAPNSSFLGPLDFGSGMPTMTPPSFNMGNLMGGGTDPTAWNSSMYGSRGRA